MTLFDFIEFRDLNINNEKEFIKKLRARVIDDDSPSRAIRILKCCDISVDKYCNKKYEQLLNNSLTEMLNLFPNSHSEIDEFIREKEIFNKLFTDFNTIQDLSGVNEVDVDKKVYSFLLASEGILQKFPQVEKIEKNEFFYNTELEKYLSTLKYDQVIDVTDTYEQVISAISSIIKYFKFKYKAKYVEIDNSFDVAKSAKHLDFFSYHSVFLEIYDNWRFFNAKVYMSDNCITVEYDDEIFSNYLNTYRYVRRKRVNNLKALELSSEMMFDNSTSILPPNQFWSLEELCSFMNFMDHFNYTEFHDIEFWGVKTSEWIRSYSLISKLSTESIDYKNPRLLKVSRNDLRKKLHESGVSHEGVSVIIEKMTYNSKSIDLMDCPLLPIDSFSYIIVPSLSKSIDFSEAFISLLQRNKYDLSKRGEIFEKFILSWLIKLKVQANSLYAKKNGSEYQCDICIYLEGNIYFIEQKMFCEPKTVRAKYEHKEKINDAVLQLDRIVTFYMDNLHLVLEQLNLPQRTRIDNYYKIVLTSTNFSSLEKDGDTFIVDANCFIRFLERNPPSIVAKNGNEIKKIFYEYFKQCYMGNITNDKFFNMIKYQPNIYTTRKNYLPVRVNIPLGNYTLDCPVYISKLKELNFMKA